MRSLGVLTLLILATAAVTAAGPRAVQVTPVDAKEFASEIRKHQGHVVLVDFWATWCVPCTKAFPKTVALQEKFGRMGLDVMSVSCDTLDDGDVPARVGKFLAEHPADVTHLISKLDVSEDGAAAFEITDGALPHFKLYGRDGKLIRTFGGASCKAIDHAVLEAAIATALKR